MTNKEIVEKVLGGDLEVKATDLNKFLREKLTQALQEKDMELSKNVALLKRILGRMNHGFPSVINAIYISPAQQLRNGADAIEKEASDYQ